MAQSPWSIEREDKLKLLWSGTLSASQIAAEIGGFEGCADGGRSAVLGKVHRLMLPARGVHASDPIEIERRRQRRRIQHSDWARAKRAGLAISDIQTIETPALPPPQYTGSLNIPFDELRMLSSYQPNQCRFIEGDAAPRFACGTETLPGESWCGHHHGIVFAKPFPMSDSERQRRSRAAAKKWFGTEAKLNGAIPFEDAAA